MANKTTANKCKFAVVILLMYRGKSYKINQLSKKKRSNTFFVNSYSLRLTFPQVDSTLGHFSSGLGPGKRASGSKVATWLSRKRKALNCCGCARAAGPSMQNVYLTTEETPGDLLENYRSGHGNR
jgi:hypothetical protein